MSDVALLLPGWGTHPSRFDLLDDHLRSVGIRTHVHQVRTDALLDDLAGRVRRHVQQLADDGQRVHLVGHSLGGLVAAWAATEHRVSPIASVTTVNTPWRGTWLAWTGTGRLAAQLRHRSPTITCLRNRLADHLLEPRGPRWLVLAAALDLGTPPTTSYRPGSASPRLERRLVPVTGHSTSLASPRLAGAVADFVERQAHADQPNRAYLGSIHRMH